LMPARCKVELDIFSGMPNPTWALTETETEHFVKQLAALPRAPTEELSGNLGYRGFIVHCARGADTELIHIQEGAVHISNGTTTVAAYDEDRELERWLLSTGKSHLSNDLFQIAEREIR